MSYHIDMSNETDFILINGVEVNKKILKSLVYIQGDMKEGNSINQGYYEIAAGYAELISFILGNIDYDNKELQKHLEFLQLQIKDLTVMKIHYAPVEMVRDQKLNYSNNAGFSGKV